MNNDSCSAARTRLPGAKVGLIIAMVAFCAGLAMGAETTVSVLNFVNTHTGLRDEKHEWLSKGLADLLITDLGSCDRLRVLTREHMQMLLEEAELTDKFIGQGAIPEAEAKWLRQYFRVDYVVFGTYTVARDRIGVHAIIIRQEDGKVVTRISESARLDDVLELEKILAARIMEYFKMGVAVDLIRALPRWTSSVPAAQRLYEGVDHFDHGRFTQAWYAFRQALEADPRYADARYWLARMSYYRQEYDHARTEYGRFVADFPMHPRVGDAIMEFVHSIERTSEIPEEMLKVYRSLRQSDWKDVQVHNQAGYHSMSPLADWVLKREQQALRYQKKYGEAFSLLAEGMDNGRYEERFPHRPTWRSESMRLMSSLAEVSEDLFNVRLENRHLPYTDIVLDPDNPTAGEDLRGQGLGGLKYKWGTNYRILAPDGHYIRKVTARIERTNDPVNDSVCRLQIRRYRYVDIEACRTYRTTPSEKCVFEILMPPGCTWFYLHPEYSGKRGASAGSFDGWSIKAELAPLGPVGRIDLRVSNASEVRTLVDGIYARCFNGIVPNLAPGPHELRVENMWCAKGFKAFETNIEIQAGRLHPLEIVLHLSEAAKALGWEDPFPIANNYPVYKLRPRRLSNLKGGRPSICVDRASGKKVVVWSHLDDLWLATSEDGVNWHDPINIALPVNSAHIESNPRMIRDERGRYCLLFVSDRGQLRNLASYVCWSCDLERWSRPVMISSTSHRDHDLIQAMDGRYIFVGGGQERRVQYKRYVVGNVAKLQLRFSSDLVQWSEPRELPGFTVLRGVNLCQDRTGIYHLVWGTIVDIWHSWSNDLRHWSKKQKVPHRLVTNSGGVRLSVSDEYLVVAMGLFDTCYHRPHYQQYQCLQVCDLAWRPLFGADPEWQPVDLPPHHVVDTMCDVAFEPGTGSLLLVWQVTDMPLNTVYPSGPVYGMVGRPRVWFTSQEGNNAHE